MNFHTEIVGLKVKISLVLCHQKYQMIHLHVFLFQIFSMADQTLR